MTQPLLDTETARRLDAQHDELLRKIDDLDRRVTAMLEEWTAIAREDIPDRAPARA